MEASFSHSAIKACNPALASSNTTLCRPRTVSYHPVPVGSKNCRATRKVKSSGWKLAAADDISSAADPVNAQITWQIIVGAVAGATPFFVAGIEFSRRIITQRRCKVCGGSGLVLREKDYFRCPGCGGFLPWQSWKRFFSG